MCSTIRNTFIIFLLSGLWHGANWTYVTWGFYHALLFVPLILLGRTKAYQGVSTWEQLPQILLTFALVTIGWVIFRAPSISDAMFYMSGMFQLGTIHSLHRFFTDSALWPANFMIILMLLIEWLILHNQKIISMFEAHRTVVTIVSCTILIQMIALLGRFEYTQFIYFQF